MKAILPLIAPLIILFLLWLLQGHAPDDKKKSSVTTRPLLTSTVNAEPELVSQQTSTKAIGASGTGLGLVTISETSIRKAADDEMTRLKKPLQSLFDHWGLGDEAASRVRDLIHNRHVQQGLARNQYAKEMAVTTTNEPTKLYQQRQNAITAQYEAELLTIIGSTKRLFDLTLRMTTVNLNHYRDTAPARKAQDNRTRKLIEAEVAQMKSSHGSNYKQMIIERYGEAAATSMFRMIEEDED